MFYHWLPSFYNKIQIEILPSLSLPKILAMGKSSMSCPVFVSNILPFLVLATSNSHCKPKHYCCCGCSCVTADISDMEQPTAICVAHQQIAIFHFLFWCCCCFFFFLCHTTGLFLWELRETEKILVLFLFFSSKFITAVILIRVYWTFM